MRRVDADRRKAVSACFVTKLSNLVWRCIGFEQGVIDELGHTGVGRNATQRRGQALSPGADHMAYFIETRLHTDAVRAFVLAMLAMLMLLAMLILSES